MGGERSITADVVKMEIEVESGFRKLDIRVFTCFPKSQPHLLKPSFVVSFSSASSVLSFLPESADGSLAQYLDCCGVVSSVSLVQGTFCWWE